MRDLTTQQEQRPDQWHWLFEVDVGIETIRGSDIPGGLALGAIAYDLECANVKVTHGLTVLGGSPGAFFMLFDAPDVLGRDSLAQAALLDGLEDSAVRIYSIHSKRGVKLEDADPLLQFEGKIDSAPLNNANLTGLGGSLQVQCKSLEQSALPHGVVNGAEVPIVVGKSEQPTLAVTDKNYSIINEQAWGINAAIVSDDAIVGDDVTITGAAVVPITYAGGSDVETFAGHRFFAVQHVLVSGSTISQLSFDISAEVDFATAQYLIYDDNAGVPGAIIASSQTFSPSVGATPVKTTKGISANLAAGTYYFAVSLSEAAFLTDLYVGVDNAGGDTGHTSFLGVFLPVLTWSAQTYDLNFEIIPSSTQVEIRLNTVLILTQAFNIDIKISNGDIVIPSSSQFGAPVAGEVVSLAVEDPPKLALGTLFNSDLIELTGYQQTIFGFQSVVAYTDSSLGLSDTANIDVAAGPTFSPAVDGVCAVLQFTTASDTSGSGDRTIELREGASFAASVVIASATIFAERLTNGRVVTVAIGPVGLHAADTYWLGIASGTPIVHGGVTAQALTATLADESFTENVRTAQLDWNILPEGVQVNLSGVSSPVEIREYILGKAGLLSDPVSYSAMITRDAGVHLGGALEGQTFLDALTFIDRHTRVLSSVVGDMHYLSDLDIVPAADVVPDDALKLGLSSAQKISFIAYSYTGGSGESGVSSSAYAQALDLPLLSDGVLAQDAADARLDILTPVYSIEPFVTEVALMPGGYVDQAILGVAALWRVVSIDVGKQNIVKARQVL